MILDYLVVENAIQCPVLLFFVDFYSARIPRTILIIYRSSKIAMIYWNMKRKKKKMRKTSELLVENGHQLRVRVKKGKFPRFILLYPLLLLKKWHPLFPKSLSPGWKHPFNSLSQMSKSRRDSKPHPTRMPTTPALQIQTSQENTKETPQPSHYPPKSINKTRNPSLCNWLYQRYNKTPYPINSETIVVLFLKISLIL